MLRTLNDFLVACHEICSLQGFEAEVIVVVVAVIDDCGVQAIFVLKEVGKKKIERKIEMHNEIMHLMK